MVTNDEVAFSLRSSGVSMTNVGELRNPSYIKQTTYSGTTASYFTERRHNLAVGNMVKIDNVTSSINPTGVGNSGYNGEFTVTGITRQLVSLSLLRITLEHSVTTPLQEQQVSPPSLVTKVITIFTFTTQKPFRTSFLDREMEFII